MGLRRRTCAPSGRQEAPDEQGFFGSGGGQKAVEGSEGSWRVAWARRLVVHQAVRSGLQLRPGLKWMRAPELQLRCPRQVGVGKNLIMSPL